MTDLESVTVVGGLIGGNSFTGTFIVDKLEADTNLFVSIRVTEWLGASATGFDCAARSTRARRLAWKALRPKFDVIVVRFVRSLSLTND